MQQQQFERFAPGPSFTPVQTADIASGLEKEQQYQMRDYRTRQQGVQANNKMLMLDEKYKQKGFEALAGFSETITKQLVEREKEQNKQAELEGLRDAYVNGVPPEVQKAFNDNLNALNESGVSTERGLNDAVENGQLGWALSRELSDMSPHMRVGYARGVLQQLSKQYPQMLQTELLDALAEDPTMSMQEKNLALQNYRYNWMMQSGLNTYNTALLDKELFPSMKQAESAVINQWQQSAEQDQRAKLGEDADMLMQQPFSQTNWEQASELYRAKGLSRGQARKQALSNVSDLETLDDWASLISFDGKTTLGDKYEKDFNAQRVAILNGEIAKNNYDDNSLKLAAREYAQQFIDAWENGEPVRQKDVERIKRLSQLNYQNNYDPRLDQYDTNNIDSRQREILKDEIERLQAAGVDTSVLLNDPNIPWDLKKDLLLDDNKGSSSRAGGGKAKDPFEKQLEKDIIQSIGSDSPAIDAVSNTQGAILAQNEAIRMYNSKRAELLKGSDAMTPEQASEEAYEYVNNMIKLGKDGQGDMVGGIGPFKYTQQGGFVEMVNGGGTAANQQRNYAAALARQQRRKIDQLFTANGDRPRDPLIDQVQLVSTDALQTAVERSGEVGYLPPASAVYISEEYFGGRVSPWEVLQRQAKSFLGEDIVLPSSLMREQQSSPRIRQLLNRFPSYNRVSRAYRPMNAQGFDPSLVPNHYGGMVAEAATANNVDPALLAGLLEQESRWNPNAVSRVGAQGLGQFMPATAAEFGVDVTDPKSSIDGAARYLSYLMDYFDGNVELAVYAYNGGMGNIERYGGPIPGNEENENYGPEVFERATKYGYRGYVPGLNPAIQQ